jgi:hypothetical protein
MVRKNGLLPCMKASNSVNPELRISPKINIIDPISDDEDIVQLSKS